MRPIWVGLDIDSTVISHCYDQMDGKDLGAIPWLRICQDKYGARFLIHSMRAGPSAEIAKQWLEERGIRIYGINSQPGQENWTASPKCFAQLYVDDRAVGTPLLPTGDINWQLYGPMVLGAVKRIQEIRDPV